jgi:hypothetical protein
MDRAHLRYLLNSGPSRVLDVRKLRAESDLAPLFKIGLLNNAILLKQSVAEGSPEARSMPPIATRIYLPYHRQHPEDGGESFLYSSDNLRAALRNLIGVGSFQPEDFEADLELFQIFNRLPSFSPYLMKDALERAHISIPTGYFMMPEREAAMIKQRMRARLRPLVAIACGGKGVVSETSIERLVEHLWQCDDMDALRPLLDAFRITTESAPEIFYCWLGVAFFENEYIKLQPRLKRMAAWLGNRAAPRDALPREVLDHFMHSVALVRKLLHGHWKRSLVILQDYTSTYEELIGAKASAARFIEFLRQSKTYFWTLGGCLGRLDQSVDIWEQICNRVNFEALPFDRGVELFTILNQVSSMTGGDGMNANGLSQGVESPWSGSSGPRRARA